jgi:CubicO group peptidase (beta-lactamase class C family)
MDSPVMNHLKTLIIQRHLPVYQLAAFDGERFSSEVFDSSEALPDLYSLSKNITALAVGVLLDQKIIRLDGNIYDVFASLYPSMNPYWKEVSVQNVLTQTSGIEHGFLDIDCDDPKSFETDYLQQVLDHPFAFKAGTHFVYSDSNYYLLARLVQEVSQTSFTDFVVRYLFNPLGIKEFIFEKDPAGNAMGATGVHLNAKDVAKIGFVFINQGAFAGKTIVSPAFIKTAMSPLVQVDSKIAYGLSIWSCPATQAFYGCGMRGQVNFLSLREKKAYVYLSHDDTGSTQPLLDYLIVHESPPGNIPRKECP